jgi:hypothetical protein
LARQIAVWRHVERQNCLLSRCRLEKPQTVHRRIAKEKPAEAKYPDQEVLGLVDVCELTTHGERVDIAKRGAKLFLSSKSS